MSLLSNKGLISSFSYRNSLGFCPKDQHLPSRTSPPCHGLQTMFKMLLDLCLEHPSALNWSLFSEVVFQTLSLFGDIFQYCFCTGDPRTRHILWKCPHSYHVQWEYHVCALIRDHTDSYLYMAPTLRSLAFKVLALPCFTAVLAICQHEHCSESL